MDPLRTRQYEASGQTNKLSVNRFNIHNESSHWEKSHHLCRFDSCHPLGRLTRAELPYNNSRHQCNNHSVFACRKVTSMSATWSYDDCFLTRQRIKNVFENLYAIPSYLLTTNSIFLKALRRKGDSAHADIIRFFLIFFFFYGAAFTECHH